MHSQWVRQMQRGWLTVVSPGGCSENQAAWSFRNTDFEKVTLDSLLEGSACVHSLGLPRH